MLELHLKNKIVDILQSNFVHRIVRDFPVNPNDYRPTTQEGEFLVKTLGYRSSPLFPYNGGRYQPIRLYDYNFVISLIVNNRVSQEELILLTDEVATLIKTSDLELQNVSLIGKPSIDVGVAIYDDQKQFQERELTINIQLLISEESF